MAKLSIDTIKIDKDFISNLPESEENKAICRAIIDLSHGLNKSVVAEGVETQEQYRFLAKIGCDLIQGFYYAKPMPESEAIEFLLANRT